MDIVLIAMLGAIVFVGIVMFAAGDEALRRREVRQRHIDYLRRHRAHVSEFEKWLGEEERRAAAGIPDPPPAPSRPERDPGREIRH